MRLPTIIGVGLFLLPASLCAQANWSPLPTPTTKDLWGVTTVGLNRAYAVGSSGVVLRSTHAGSSWTVDSVLYKGRTSTLGFVEAADSTGLWTGFWASPTFRSTDCGVSWVKVDIDTVVTISRVRFISPRLGFATGFELSSPYRGRILRTTDAGNSWHLLLDTAGRAFQDVCFVDSLLGIAVGSFNPVEDNFDPESIFRTTDGGVTWSEVAAPGNGPLTSIIMWNRANGLACGDNAHLLSTNDSGKTWVQCNLGLQTTSSIRYVTMTSPADAWAVVGALGSVYHSTDNGTTWPATPLPGAKSVFGLHFASNDIGYAVGSSGGVWQYSPITGVARGDSSVASPHISIFSHPNPFNPSTTISFSLDYHSYVELIVVDALGRRVADLLRGTVRSGVHEVTFDGSTMTSGTYFAILTLGPRRVATKIVLLR